MTLFNVSAAAFKPLTSKGGIQTFQFIYFFSSFWGQFGEFLRVPHRSGTRLMPSLKHLQHSPFGVLLHSQSLSACCSTPPSFRLCSLPVVQGLTVPLSCWLVSCTPLRCAQPHTAFLLVLPSLGVCGPPSTSTTWAAGRHLVFLVCFSPLNNAGLCELPVLSLNLPL